MWNLAASWGHRHCGTRSPLAMGSDVARLPLQRQRVGHNYRRQLQSDGHGDRHRELHAEAKVTSSYRVPMTGYEGAVYYATMNIGSDAYRMIVDTGSTDVWVSCYYFDQTRCQTTCPDAATKIAYGSGEVCVSTELLPIRLGNVLIRDYSVGIALNPNAQPTSKTSLLLGDSEGLLGLGYPALATVTSVPGYVIQFLNSFSVYLAPKDAAEGSFLLLNAVDDSLIQQNGLVPYTIPVKTQTHWTVGMTGFQFGGRGDPFVPCTKPVKDSCDVIVDTGTTLLIIPPQVYTILVNEYLIPGGCYLSEEVSSRGMYICYRATKLPTLQFVFDSLNFYLDMEDYINRKDGLFLVEVQASTATTGSQTWVLGGTFLKKFYSSYVVSKSVVLYCQEGKSCDKDGSIGKAATDYRVSNSTKSTSGSSAATAIPGSGTGSSISMTPSPSSDGTGNSGTGITVAPGSSSNGTNGNQASGTTDSGSDHTTTIAIVASLVGVAFVLLVVLAVRRYLIKRNTRQQASNVGVEMETIASTGGAGSAYISGATLTPKASATT